MQGPLPSRTRPANDDCFCAPGAGGGRWVGDVAGTLCDAGGSVNVAHAFQYSAPSDIWYLLELSELATLFRENFRHEIG
jgi:hypothetical protein